MLLSINISFLIPPSIATPQWNVTWEGACEGVWKINIRGGRIPSYRRIGQSGIRRKRRDRNFALISSIATVVKNSSEKAAMNLFQPIKVRTDLNVIARKREDSVGRNETMKSNELSRHQGFSEVDAAISNPLFKSLKLLYF